MNNVENSFIQRINDVYEKCSGFETYGSTTEFYDEDGVVLMTATEEDSNKIAFVFVEDAETYVYEEIEKAQTSEV